MALKASTNAAAHRAASLADKGQRDKMEVTTHSMAWAPGDLLEEVPTESEKVDVIRRTVISNTI
jgi:hypothetical protein